MQLKYFIIHAINGILIFIFGFILCGFLGANSDSSTMIFAILYLASVVGIGFSLVIRQLNKIIDK